MSGRPLQAIAETLSRRLPEPTYPHHDLVRPVYANGFGLLPRERVSLSATALADQTIGFEEEARRHLEDQFYGSGSRIPRRTDDEVHTNFTRGVSSTNLSAIQREVTFVLPMSPVKYVTYVSESTLTVPKLEIATIVPAKL